MGESVAASGVGNLSFVNADVGYGLIRVDGTMLGVASTHDGGQHWTVVSNQKALRPLTSESGLEFSSPQRGWIWQEAIPGGGGEPSILDQPFLTTTDGGQTWKPVSGITDVVDVQLRDSSIWVVGTPGTTAAKPGDTVIWVSTDGGRIWQPPSAGAPVSDVSRVAPSTAYGLEDSIVQTTDAGATWTSTGGKLPAPCPSGDSEFTAGGVGDLWYLCAGVVASGMQPKVLYRSSDAGHTWQTLKSITVAGYPDDLTVLSPTTALLGLDREGLVETSDAGQAWSPAINRLAQVTYYAMYSPTGGVALLDGQPYHTTDAVHWYPTL